MDGKWLAQKLRQNGYSTQQLAQQTGLDLDTIEEIIETSQGTKYQWDCILDALNTWPAVRYPSKDIIADLNSDIETYTGEGTCTVYYGVAEGALIFGGYRCQEDGKLHGAADADVLPDQLNTTLQDALTLFTQQTYVY